MNRKQYSFLAFLAVVGGLVGGIVSSRFFVGEPVYAQKVTKDERRISAEQFDVVDKNGNIRATFGLLPQGSPILSMYDQEAHTRFSVFLDTGRTQGLVFLDREGRPSVGLIVDSIGTPSLNIYGGRGNSHRISLSSGGDGQSGIAFYDDGGIIRTGLGSSGLILYDELASAKIGLSASAADQGLFFFNDDKNRKIGVSLFNSKDGEAGLSLNDKDGRPRAIIGANSLETGRTGIVEKRPVSSVVLFDKDGKVMWKAP